MEYKRICPKCQKEIEYQSYSSWYNANKKNSLCRSCAYKKSTERCANLQKLLLDTPEAFYWIGFLLADGSFLDGRLSLALKKSDSDQVHKFGDYVEYTGSYGKSETTESVKCKDIDTVSKICSKFDIKPSKTYNPPLSILNFDKTLVVALIAGFIDGDGNISNQSGRKDFKLRIKNHSSWLHILREINSVIYPKKNVCKLNSQGYAELQITNTASLQEFKKSVMALDLPLMVRKWEVIDLEYVSKLTKAEETKNKVRELFASGIKKKDIAIQLGICAATVTKYTKNINNDKN